MSDLFGDNFDKEVICIACGDTHRLSDRTNPDDGCPKCGSMVYRPKDYFKSEMQNYLRLDDD